MSALVEYAVVYENPQAPSTRVLVIDNYDSFTFNLVQMLVVQASRIDVVRNDRVDLPRGSSRIRPTPWLSLLSPRTPGRPTPASASSWLQQRDPEIPLLGVCLGHQAARRGLRRPRRGARRSSCTARRRWSSTKGHRIFEGLPSPFEATRYHSLCVRAGDAR